MSEPVNCGTAGGQRGFAVIFAHLPNVPGFVDEVGDEKTYKTSQLFE